jgi:hypothetical protein
VLILDQLDAIRWTSAHSTDALVVCRELLRQVFAFRREGRDIKAILACRTFDLEHDVGLRSWLDQMPKDSVARIEVGHLPEEEVRRVTGDVYDSMTGRQKSILGNPQNLSLWVELRKQGASPQFRSPAGLMRKFWEFKRRQLESKEGIRSTDSNLVLETLDQWLEKRGRLAAPARVLGQCSPNAVDALCSEGILQRDDNRFAFAHQSYRDFLVAERVLDELDSGRTILDWLGVKSSQTLARRGQLRLALALLEEERGDDFASSVDAILRSPHVRFHLKHLVLEIIGQIENPGQALVEFCLELLNCDYWRPHILDTVFLGHRQYVSLLIEKGLMDNWLASHQEESNRWALRLLRLVAEDMPEDVAKLLAPYAAKSEEWGRDVLSVIGWRAENDTREIFDLRLTLARRGILPIYIDWPPLCARYPLWALELVETVAATLPVDHEAQRAIRYASNTRHWTAKDLDALCVAAKQHPCEAWDLLMPHVERLSEPVLREASALWHREQQEIPISQGVVELLTMAGQKLAQGNAPLLLDRTKPIEGHPSRVIQKIIAEAYASLPPDCSDVGVCWLLQDLSLFRLGDGFDEPIWSPAASLIKALSPHCSPQVFQQLEAALVSFVDPDEKRDAGYYLQGRRRGSFQPYWGRARYFLLPALPKERRSERTSRLVTWLCQTYGKYPDSYFVRLGGFSGWVGSKLDSTLDRISDNSWLAIVSNKGIPEESSRSCDGDHFAVSDVWHFSQSLGRIARRFPERFGRLALMFVEDTASAYVAAILPALSLTKPDSAVPEVERDSWEQASVETVLQVVDRFCDMTDREVAMSFCRLIRARGDEPWPDSALERLIHLASTHADPRPDELSVLPSEESDANTVRTLYQHTINCVRGCAAGAIGGLLWHHPDRLTKLRAGIVSLVDDAHPAVRMAAVRALLPMLNIDRDQAVTWFCKACEKDERVAASPDGVRFLTHIFRSHCSLLGPLIEQMVGSNWPEAANRGAQVATACYLYNGLLADLVDACLTGSKPQRTGAAKVAAAFVVAEEHTQKCTRLLIPLLDDPESDVRSEAATMFRTEFLQSPESIELATRYLRSQAHKEDPSRIVRFLSAYMGSLLPLSEIILVACTVLVPSPDDEINLDGHAWFLTREGPALLLRLYDEAKEKDQQIADRCLDMWDVLFESSTGLTRVLTKALDN